MKRLMSIIKIILKTFIIGGLVSGKELAKSIEE